MSTTINGGPNDSKGDNFPFDIPALACYYIGNNTRHASVERRAHPSGLFFCTPL